MSENKKSFIKLFISKGIQNKKLIGKPFRAINFSNKKISCLLLSTNNIFWLNSDRFCWHLNNKLLKVN